jgi:hypothetical protein
LAVALAIAAHDASAAIVITEVDPYGSAGASTYSADWFELTNTGSSAVSIAGWTMTDNHAASSTSNPYGTGNTISIGNLTGASKTFGAAALTLASGATSIAAGQSVIFLESSGAATSAASTTIINNFTTAWFGSSVPASLTVGTYNDGGASTGVYGLSQTADMVNIFNGSTSTAGLMASVAIGADSTAAPYSTFDNTAGLNNATLTQKSAVGVNGAFLSASGQEIGSPAVVPLPAAAWLLLSGMGGLGAFAKKRRRSQLVTA